MDRNPLYRDFLFNYILNGEDDAEGQQRQRFQPRLDAFDLSDQLFIKNYRLTKHLTQDVINLVEQHLPAPKRASEMIATLQVLAALNFFATGCYQTPVGQNHNMSISQPSVSRALHNVCNVLNLPEVLNEWVHFPSTMAELHNVEQQFRFRHGIPGVIGCIDCTHIAIKAPSLPEQENVYVNRKGFHSLNVQLICDTNLRITNVNARFPGSTHDSYIWNNSQVQDIMRMLHLRGHAFYLLGDSGYALRPWMMTPAVIQHDDNRAAVERYNQVHARVRSLIERCNGVLKSRFRCLLQHRVLHYDPVTAAKIVNSCVVLHNMCLGQNIPLPEDMILAPEDDQLVDHPPEEAVAAGARDELAAGRLVRNNLIERL